MQTTRCLSKCLLAAALFAGSAAGWGQGGAGGSGGTRGPAGAARYVGFDRNEYPGDEKLDALHRAFAFTGYWLNNPPGETSNGWIGKREVLRAHGFGFLVLANGRLDAEIRHRTRDPRALGEADAAKAIAAAGREGFPAGTIVFLDQEEGGRLLEEQAAYLFGWTEAVARSGFRPGVYASGQAVKEERGKTITTAQDIRDHVKAGHLHEVALWVSQDACPPAPGCVLRPPAPGASGTEGAVAWQYAQSPGRPELTRSCRRTYAADENCYVSGKEAVALKGITVDLDVAGSGDPSGGR